MFWRVSFDEKLGVMECRKYRPSIGGRPFASVGEIYHSHDGLRGSLMRFCGYPSWKVIGLDCGGWWHAIDNRVYAVSNPAHFLFRELEPVDFSDRRTFGHAPTGFRRAGGHEGDTRISSFATPQQPIPKGGTLPQEPAGIETMAIIQRKNVQALDYFVQFRQVDRATAVEMVY